MSYNNDLLAIPFRKRRCLPVPSCSSQHANPSTRTQHRRTSSSTSLPPYVCNQADFDDLLHSSDDTTLDSDLDRRSASSTTHLSYQSDLPTRLSEARQSGFLYSLREPGQMTAQRVQRLRARTAAVIMSLPSTFEEVVDIDELDSREAASVSPVLKVPRLRRVSGIHDLRGAFRDCERGPVHFASTSSLGISKSLYEFGLVAAPTPSLSPLSPHPSLRTLVELGNGLPHGSGDLKTLCGSTFSSTSIASRFTAKLHSSLPLSRPSLTRSPSDASQSLSPKKYLIHNPLTPQPHCHMSLRLDTSPSRSPGETVWSCAKISQSALKRTARRGHPPRRVFSNPVAALSP